MKQLILCILLIAATATHAQKPFYVISGKVIDHKTGKGIPGVYVAFQGLHIALFFGGPEYFDDLALDTTDSKGSFSIKVPAAITDSFAQKHGGPFGDYNFCIEARSHRSGEHYEIYGHQHIISELLNIQEKGTGYNDRVFINSRIRMLTPDNKPLKEDIAGIVMPYYKGSYLQFQLPERDSAFLNNGPLYVSVQELSDKDSVVKHGHTFYDKDHLNDPTLVRPYVPMNIILAKWLKEEGKRDTFAIIKQVSLQPGELKKIVLVPGKQQNQ